MLPSGFEPESSPREGKMIGRATLWERRKWWAQGDFHRVFPSFRGFEKASLHTFLSSFWKKLVLNSRPPAGLAL